MISKRALVYAKSLFAISPEFSSLKELETFQAVLNEPLVFKFFDSPLIGFEKKRQILLNDLGKSFSPVLINFLSLLVERKLLFLFSEIKKAFENLLNEKENKLQGEVFSSTDLDSKQKSKLEVSLKSFFKKTIKLKDKKVPELIGGVYVRAGGYIFNDSLSFHLNKFKTQGE